jgi:hypothetical protein
VHFATTHDKIQSSGWAFFFWLFTTPRSQATLAQGEGFGECAGATSGLK